MSKKLSKKRLQELDHALHSTQACIDLNPRLFYGEDHARDRRDAYVNWYPSEDKECYISQPSVVFGYSDKAECRARFFYSEHDACWLYECGYYDKRNTYEKYQQACTEALRAVGQTVE